jgi:competence protein ComFC
MWLQAQQAGRRAVQVGMDFLLPSMCAGCERVGWPFCPHCAQEVAPMPGTICARCGRVSAQAGARCAYCRGGAMAGLEMVRAAALFQAPLREAIHAFKYEGRRELAEPLARYLVTVFAHEPWSGMADALDVVIPAPLHATRLRARGYNQSELLAQAFADRVGLPCAPAWMARVRATQPQVDLRGTARRANVAGAFAASPQVTGKTILLVDDVLTTGATLQACAEAALAAGARRVYGLTLAAPAPPQIAESQS